MIYKTYKINSTCRYTVGSKLYFFKDNSRKHYDEYCKKYEEHSVQNARDNLPFFCVALQDGGFSVIIYFFEQIISDIFR